MEAKEPSRPGGGGGGRQGVRRGGYGDAGGICTGTGGLPEAPLVAVGSEAELCAELEKLANLLEPTVAWIQRVDALLRLEGLVKGGAAGFAAFAELLAGLRDALAAQMQERRSAVSRQACHAVGTLAAACGMAFEPLAVHLLPVVFKTLAMGIQIVSEEADACVHTILAHCPSPRLLPKLCTTVCGDRNGRLRHSASEYLLRVLETWHPAEYERQQEGLERAMLAAVQDAQAETRVVGRSMYGAYAHACPTQAQALLVRLGRDKQLQDKLLQAAEEYVPGILLPAGPSQSQPASRRSSLGNSRAGTPRGLLRTASLPAAATGQQGVGAVRLAPLVPKLALSALSSAAESTRGSPSHPSSARSTLLAAAPAPTWQQTATARENQPDNRATTAAAAVQCTPRSVFPKTLARREATVVADADGDGDSARHQQLPPGGARERLAPRCSIGGAALRMSIATFRRQAEPIEAPEDAAVAPTAPLLQRAAAPQRVPAPAGALRGPLLPPPPPDVQQQQPLEHAGRPLTARRLGALECQSSSVMEDSEVSSLSSSLQEEGTASSAASLAPLLSGLGKTGISWAERVALFQSVQAALQQSGSSQHMAADVASNADRLVAALLEGAGDAHFRVATAALAALAAGLASASARVFEPQLDRVMTALFARVVDPKEQIRQLVGTALAAVLQQHSADAIVAALVRSLQANRAPRVKCAVMGYFAAAAGGGSCPPTAAACEAEHQQQQRAPLLQQLTGSALGGLLRSMLQLATDKNPDIRGAAAEAVAAAYHGGEAQAVLAAVHSLPPADALAVQRAIGPAIQQRGRSDAEAASAALAAPPRPGSRAAAAAAGSAPASQPPSGSVTSRRHSGDRLAQLAAAQQRRQRADSSSLTARSRQGSDQLPPAKQQAPVAPPAAAAAAAPAELTPEPPSPFMWRGQSASPSPAAAPVPRDTAAAAAAEGSAALSECAAAASAPAAPTGRPMLPVLQQQPAAAAAAAPAADQLATLRLSDLAPFDDVMAGQLQRLLAQLQQGPSSEALQGLSRLAHVLPAAAWPPCFEQVMAATCGALDSSSPVVQEAGLMLTRDLAAAAPPSLFLPALPALLPRLLARAAELEVREVAAAADEALDQLLLRAPPQSCLGLLAPCLPASPDQLTVDCAQGAQLHATVRSLQRVVGRLQPAGLGAHLQPLLVPGLCLAYRSPLADVRKATVDCLVAIWQVVGDSIKTHLESLSASQMKLLSIYLDKARSAAR